MVITCRLDVDVDEDEDVESILILQDPEDVGRGG